MMDALEKIIGLTICPPMGYMEFMNLVMNSSFVVTDSGGGCRKKRPTLTFLA